MIYTLDQIKQAQAYVPQLIEALEGAYVKYSTNQSIVPPVGMLHFDEPEGNCYIKYGYLNGDETFAVKIFNGWPGNASLGLPTGDGLIVVFNAKTGQVKDILLDEGWLTCLRTATAALLSAKHLGPKTIECIGIAGTGTEAHAVMDLLPYYSECKKVKVWGYVASEAEAFVKEYQAKGYDIEACSMKDVCAASNLIFTATISKTPLITADMVKPGTHITGIGADADGKNEIDASVFAKADIIVDDSCAQCFVDGDTSFALKAGAIKEEDVIELGILIKEGKGRTSDDQITICDLTGIAVQDIVAAAMVSDILSGKFDQ